MVHCGAGGVRVPSKIGRITTAGTITEYSIPSSYAAPTGIVAGPDGALWFTEQSGAIGRITISGTITEYPSRSQQWPRRNCGWTRWRAVVHRSQPSIGRITTAGTITEYPCPGSCYPSDITAGPDGALWFTAIGPGDSATVGDIGRITTPLSTHRDTSDFNADGKSDILWQNTSGQAAIWLMNGTTAITKASVGANPGRAGR